MLKRIMASSLALLMTSAAVAACGESSDNGPAVTTAAQAEAVTEAETESEYSAFASEYLKFDEPNVPDTKYGGRKFNIIRPGDKEPPQEETGDVVDDATYLSQRLVEEKLEVDIDYTMVPSIVDIQPALKKAVMAGDSSYDIAVNHCIEGIPNLLKDRLVHDWNHIPNVNFDQPYWNQSLNSTLSVKGILPIACGNYFISSPMCIFFNKQIQKDYGIEDLYGAVNEGVWTLDRFVADAKLVSSDLNGDGVYGVEDLYGFIGMSDYQFMGFLAGCNQFVVEKDDEDFPTVAVDNEKTFNIFTKLHDLIYGTTSAKVWAYGTDQSTWVKFTDNHALFEIEGGLGTAQSYRSMETDFGIIPCPKYDENQEEYMSFELGSFLMVPVTAADTALCGTVCELLCAESRRNVMPVYVDKMLVSKAARDNESESMIYLILDSIVYDFGVNLGQYNALSYVLGFSLREDTSDFASYVSKQLKSANKHYSKVYDYYLGYQDMY